MGGLLARRFGYPVALVWDAVADSTGYTLEVGTTEGGDEAYSGSAAGDATGAMLTLPSGTYYFTVTALPSNTVQSWGPEAVPKV
jgi:hypothetical protein